jgi:nondiscriminating aspartyl-tRNA synthetase
MASRITRFAIPFGKSVIRRAPPVIRPLSVGSSTESAFASIFSSKVKFGAINNDNSLAFGDYESIASESESVRPYASVADLGTPKGPVLGTDVWVRGRIAGVRMKGNVCFLVLRSDSFYTVQACHFLQKSDENASRQLIKFMGSLTSETIVDIRGTLVAATVKSCTQQTVELQAHKVLVVSRAPSQLPFSIEEASRPDPEVAPDAPLDKTMGLVGQDLRLNNRWLDLRVPANNAVMRIKSGVLQLFRESLYRGRFIEINTPKLIAGQSEGGSEVFRTDYFGQPACLAQSPQLYKQMAISSDLHRVFEVGPVFRAEKSQTRRHLCEFVGLDIEMEIKQHYNETLHVLHNLFRDIFNGLEERYAAELSVVRQQYPSAPVQFTADPLIIHWEEGLELLRAHGVRIGDFDDLNTAQEILLGSIVRKKYNSDFFMLDQYPSAIRPFYTMPSPRDRNYSNSYDLFLRGQEICSGAQRQHNPVELEKAIVEKGVDPNTLRHYIESFRHGISPHAGAGIGLERVVFLYLGDYSSICFETELLCSHYRFIFFIYFL